MHKESTKHRTHVPIIGWNTFISLEYEPVFLHFFFIVIIITWQISQYYYYTGLRNVFNSYHVSPIAVYL